MKNMIREAGSNGIAGTTWEDDCRKKMPGKLSDGKPIVGTGLKLLRIAKEKIFLAELSSGSLCFIGRMTRERFDYRVSSHMEYSEINNSRRLFMKLEGLLEQLSTRILGIKGHHPVRVGIDGPCGAGKTTFADTLYKELKRVTEREVIRIHADDFHNPKAIRYRQGRTSGRGYYEDAFDKEAIFKDILKPLGPNGNLEYKNISLDLETDAKVVLPKLQATQEAILIMEGIFLFRPELVDHWDYKIFIEVPPEIAEERSIARDMEVKQESKSELAKIYRLRYMEAFNIYSKEAAPKEKADLVIDNSD